MSISLPDCLPANEVASTTDVLAGFVDGSAMGQAVSQKERDYLSVKMMVRLCCLRSTRILSANGGAKSIA